jgi:hypothetical protein
MKGKSYDIGAAEVWITGSEEEELPRKSSSYSRKKADRRLEGKGSSLPANLPSSQLNFTLRIPICLPKIGLGTRSYSNEMRTRAHPFIRLKQGKSSRNSSRSLWSSPLEVKNRELETVNLKRNLLADWLQGSSLEPRNFPSKPTKPLQSYRPNSIQVETLPIRKTKNEWISKAKQSKGIHSLSISHRSLSFVSDIEISNSYKN